MIDVANLYFSYAQNGRFQVKDVSFSIAPGQILGLLGPNGAGKSTTQKILTGLLPLQKGQVRIAGEDIRKAGRKVFNQIGVSFEQPNLYKKLTGLENLQFHRGLYDVPTEEPLSLLRRMGLEDVARQRAGTYSKGMQQRLMLARSLLNRPKIWFLDEPTAGLDPSAARDIKDLILERRGEGVTIFLTTHDMHVAEELCDHVAFINSGEILAMDTPRNLKLQYGERILIVEYRVDGQVITERLNQARDEDRRRLYELLEAGRVETIHSQEATLEAVFIALAGRGLS